MQFVLIPAGTFQMGSPETEAGRRPDEQQHEVEITQDFYLGVHEVTQRQYEKVMGINPSRFSPTGGSKDVVAGLDTRLFPVELVSWHEAVMFCEKLNELPEERVRGRRYRLPTEAEWEYACRGGASHQVFGFGNSLSSRQANFNGSYPYGTVEKGPHLGRTTQVGSYSPNAFGLHDMHGNVMELCADWHANYQTSPQQDPSGPVTGTHRVIRGGGGSHTARDCRSASRDRVDPGSRSAGLGFRVICSPSRRIP